MSVYLTRIFLYLQKYRFSGREASGEGIRDSQRERPKIKCNQEKPFASNGQRQLTYLQNFIMIKWINIC